MNGKPLFTGTTFQQNNLGDYVVFSAYTQVGFLYRYKGEWFFAPAGSTLTVKVLNDITAKLEELSNGS